MSKVTYFNIFVDGEFVKRCFFFISYNNFYSSASFIYSDVDLASKNLHPSSNFLYK